MQQIPPSKRRRRRPLHVERCEPRHLLTTIELSPIADNTIYEDLSTGYSNGVGEHLFVGRTGSLADSMVRRGLIRFDFNEIPTGANIDSAALQLTVSKSAPGSGNRNVSLFPVLADWGEGQSDAPGPEGTGTSSQADDASWFHRFFPAVNWVNPGGDFNPLAPSATTAVGLPNRYTWSSEQMKADVATWLADPDMNFGWILVGDEQTDKTARRMASRENPNDAQRPKLIVEYSLTTLTGPNGPTNADPFEVTIDFGKSVTGFTAQDILVTGGSVNQLVDSGNGVFLASINPDRDGTVTVEVPAGVAVDSGGTGNPEATPYSVVVDLTAPSPVIEGPASPLLAERFELSIDFGEVVNEFDLPDISTTNGIAEQLDDKGGGLYTVTMLGETGTTVSVNLDVGIAQDLAGNANTAALTYSVQIPEPSLDFGDAPLTYPVTQTADGARHVVGSLFLGSTVDAEFDGNPSNAADGDQNDEDGVSEITSMLVSSEPTVASLLVEASQSGSLNGWVDFNQDGDWNDVGEQIAQGVAVVAGPNVISVAIPGGAKSGDTYARFRLSTVANLPSDGFAPDGEVEDYQLGLSEANEAILAVEMFDPQLNVDVEQGEIIIRTASTELFRGPTGVNALEVLGTDVDDRISIDLGSFSIPTNGLLLDGAIGANTLVLLGDGSSINFTRSEVAVSRFDLIDLSGDDITDITLNSEVIRMLQPIDSRLELSVGIGDRVTIDSVDQWRMISPVIVDDNFRLVAENESGTEWIETSTLRPWQHFFRPDDINNNGQVAANDALIIVNELARRAFSGDDGMLVDPLSLPQWPGNYYDQSGDGRVSGLDALRVVNSVARQGNQVEGEAVYVIDLTATDGVDAGSNNSRQDSLSIIVQIEARITGMDDHHSVGSHFDSSEMGGDLLDEDAAKESIEAVDWLLSLAYPWWQE